jgi:hypothetical protein
LPETGHIAGKHRQGIGDRVTRRRSMMRWFRVAIPTALSAALIGSDPPANAQDPAHTPIQQVQTATPAGPGFYAPFVWNGNALDQKILDAQAQMLPLRRLIRPHLRHHHRG